ncbi:nuclear transcription factor Y subunit B-3-like [Pyrus ussuriensis x Pyrus communis]|uniref:Nuclear transcription factor Y subunit B-3-like n=1 Tax=Pyrus ussuriensis x Pyrus communis TaxID=2448454 RepID=A0A5N5GIR7_9ROSA|nr:nuclear transcription factor Y subunit B-3-like [Pyrus ussuriensis x Pyrus communis]
MADSDNDSGGAHTKSELSPREQDRLLPIANVSRIMKKALPANAKISKDAKETASDKCQREKRKTINGDDLLWAMTTLGFEEYVEPLKVYLQRFREMEGEKSSVSARDKDGSGGVGYEGGGGSSGGGGVYWQQQQQQQQQQQHQGHVYGGSGFHQMGVSGVGMGKSGPGSNMGRPR